MTTSVSSQSSSGARLWTMRSLRILLALAFLAAGAAKVAGVPAMIQVFDALGLGQWFRYVTGVVEIVGAVAAGSKAWRSTPRGMATTLACSVPC